MSDVAVAYFETLDAVTMRAEAV